MRMYNKEKPSPETQTASCFNSSSRPEGKSRTTSKLDHLLHLSVSFAENINFFPQEFLPPSQNRGPLTGTNIFNLPPSSSKEAHTVYLFNHLFV